MYAMLNLYRPFKTLNEIPHVIDFIFGHFFTLNKSLQQFIHHKHFWLMLYRLSKKSH